MERKDEKQMLLALKKCDIKNIDKGALELINKFVSNASSITDEEISMLRDIINNHEKVRLDIYTFSDSLSKKIRDLAPIKMGVPTAPFRTMERKGYVKTTCVPVYTYKRKLKLAA